MRVLLIYPNTIESPKEIAVGIASISATLKEDGHSITLLDTTFGNRSDTDIQKIVDLCAPELVCISIATNEFKFCIHIIDLIKAKYPAAKVIAGGYHPTTAPEETLNVKNIDMICVGEGDLPIRDVAKMLSKSEYKTNIANIWFKKDNKIISNPLGSSLT